MFGNINYRVLKKNNRKKEKIKDQLEQLKSKVKNSDLKNMIGNLISQVDSKSSDSKKCVEYDKNILKYLECALVPNTPEKTIKIYVKNIAEELVKRNSSDICDDVDFFRKTKKEIKEQRKDDKKDKKIEIQNLLSPEELLKISINQYQKDIEEYKKQQQQALKESDKNEYDVISIEITTLEHKIALCSNENMKIVLYRGYKELDAAQKAIRKESGFTDADFSIAIEKLQEFGINIEEETKEVKKVADAYNKSGKGQTQTQTQTQFSSSNNVTENKTSFQFDSFEMKQIILGVDEAIDKINGSINRINIDLDILDVERNVLADNLRDMLNDRRKVSQSESKILDTKIDQMEKLYQINGQKIDSKRNFVARLSEKLEFLNKIKIIKDMEDATKELGLGNSRIFDNMESFSLYIKDYISQCNDELDKMGMANSVASSTSWNSSSVASTDIKNGYKTEVKDEDKYKALEIELGVRKE